MITSNENIKNSKSRLLRISSEDKSIGDNGRFSVDVLSNGGIIDNVKGYIVHSIQCPNVFDNVPEYANTLAIQRVAEPIASIVIPNSYYFIDDLILQLQTSIQTKLTADGFGDTVVIAKVGTFPNEKIQFTFTGSDYNLLTAGSISPIIGLTANVTAPNGVATSVQNIYNLIGETELYVHSRTLAPNNLMEATGAFSVVDKLNLDQPFGTVCYSNFNNDSTHFKKYFPFESLKTLRTINITLRNRTGEILVLPPNFNFTMMVTLFYQ